MALHDILEAEVSNMISDLVGKKSMLSKDLHDWQKKNKDTIAAAWKSCFNIFAVMAVGYSYYHGQDGTLKSALVFFGVALAAICLYIDIACGALDKSYSLDLDELKDRDRDIQLQVRQMLIVRAATGVSFTSAALDVLERLRTPSVGAVSKRPHYLSLAAIFVFSLFGATALIMVLCCGDAS